MDGNVAPMDKICDLAEKYDALVMVDESHSAGVVGATGHGVSEFFNTYGRVDIYTGTLGKAFGGAMGGFTTGRKEIIDMLRQRSRPYLFSNSVAPAIVGAAIETFNILKESNELHDKLVENVNYFRDKMMAAGFDIKPTQIAICAVSFTMPSFRRFMPRRCRKKVSTLPVSTTPLCRRIRLVSACRFLPATNANTSTSVSLPSSRWAKNLAC